jgi:hypothetical protein
LPVSLYGYQFSVLHYLFLIVPGWSRPNTGRDLGPGKKAARIRGAFRQTTGGQIGATQSGSSASHSVISSPFSIIHF